MKFRLILFATGLLAAVAVYQASPASSAAQRSKPVKEVPFHTDGGSEPPKTLSEAWSKSDIVIDGVVEAAVPADEDTVIITTYRIHVIEAFKADERLKSSPSTVLVTRMGGVRDLGDHVVRKFDTAFPPFEMNERYVLFLKKLRGDEYTPAFGPNAAFLIRYDGTKARGSAELSRTLASRRYDVFRQLLLNERGR